MLLGAQNALAEEDPTTYTVAGMKEFLGGESSYDATNTDNDMTLQADGKYTLVKKNVSLTGGSWYMYKICENHSWDVTYTNKTAGEGNSYNSYFSVGDNGTYDIMIVFDPSNKSESWQGVSDIVKTTVSIARENDSWSATNFLLEPASDFASCSGKITLPSGTDHFQVVLRNGDWKGTESSISRASSSATFNKSGSSYNCEIIADLGGEYTFTYTYATNALVVTYPSNTYNRNGLTATYYGTICLPYGSSSFTGMTVHSITGKTQSGDAIVLSAPIATMVAGTPYVFCATGTSISVTYSGDPDDAQADTYLVGNLSDADMAVPEGKYILTTEGLRKVGSGATNVKIANNRAYFDLSSQGLAPAHPGQRVIQIIDDVTSIEDIDAENNATKVVENGQLLIKRNGETYDMVGRMVK